MKVDEGVYKAWQTEKKNPECKVGKGWRSSMLYDFYAMQPVAVA